MTHSIVDKRVGNYAAGLAFLFAIKPIIDALYDFGAVRYGYVVLLIFATALIRVNEGFRWAKYDKFLAGTAVVFCYFLLRTAGDVDAVVEFFKLASPFIVAILVFPRMNSKILSGIVWYAYFNIFVNFLLLPFDYAWVMWGDYNTFKGLYYFKTDLAFSLCISLSVIFISKRFKLDPLGAVCFFVSAIEIFLANSRANYLILALIAMAVLFVNAKNIKQFVWVSILFCVAALVFLNNFDDSTQLAFDVNDEGALTQGRDLIWSVLINEGFSNFSPFQWVFGEGYFADFWLNYNVVPVGEPNNAHNDFMHLAYNYGLIGILTIYTPWYFLIKMQWKAVDRAGRIGIAIVIVCYFIQGLTAVMAPFATKTWGLVYIFLLVFEKYSSSSELRSDV